MTPMISDGNHCGIIEYKQVPIKDNEIQTIAVLKKKHELSKEERLAIFKQRHEIYNSQNKHSVI